MALRAEGVDEVAEALTSSAVMAPAKAYGVVVHYGAVLQRQVKANAGGRPGPERVTGQYVGSIRRRSRPLVAGGYSDVGTDSDQGHRLEAGFVGTDSRGHRVHQPPYPHFGPALDSIDAPFTAGLAGAVFVG